MRKELSAALAAIFMMATPAVASNLDDIAKATYKLYSGSDGICSMTLVKNTKKDVLFLTASHCTWRDDKNLNVRHQTVDQKNLRDVLSEKTMYLKVVKNMKKKDVALLQVKDPNVVLDGVKPVDVAEVAEANTLKLGDDLVAFGYPGAEILAITKGTFTGKVPQVFIELDQDMPMYQTTVPLAGGNSGGAAYAEFPVAKGSDAKTWKLIGTTTGMQASIMTWFQTAETVHDALRGFVTAGPKVEIDKKAIQGSPLGIDQR